MTRLIYSLFALALAVSFSACEGQSVADLPEHYQHKMNHGSDHHGSNGAKSEKHPENAKDPNIDKKDAPKAH